MQPRVQNAVASSQSMFSVPVRTRDQALYYNVNKCLIYRLLPLTKSWPPSTSLFSLKCPSSRKWMLVKPCEMHSQGAQPQPPGWPSTSRTDVCLHGKHKFTFTGCREQKKSFIRRTVTKCLLHSRLCCSSEDTMMKKTDRNRHLPGVATFQ